MNLPHHVQWSSILDLLLELETMETRSEFYERVITGILRLIPADVSVSCFVDDHHGPRACATNVHPRVMDDFNNYYRTIWPVEDTSLRSQRQTDYREWENTEYVTDFIRAHRIRRSLISSCHGFSVALHRGATALPFSERERAILTVLDGHLANLYKWVEMGERDLFGSFTRVETSEGSFPLTRRETEVLRLAARRLTGEEIAAQLGISPRTVEKHFTNMYEKTGVGNRWSLLRLFLGPGRSK